MSPVEIEIALHYFYRREDLRFPASDAQSRAIVQMIDAGMLARSPDGVSPKYVGTEGLRVYVEALKAVPLPRLETKWVMP
jgi:hypothetical protein